MISSYYIINVIKNFCHKGHYFSREDRKDELIFLD